MSKIAEWLGNDVAKCNFEITTDRPTISIDKNLKAFETEMYTTVLSTGGDVHTVDKAFKQIATEIETTAMPTGFAVVTFEEPFKNIATDSETTMLTTDLITNTFDITVQQSTKEFETTTEAFTETLCARKVAQIYLNLDSSTSKVSFIFKKFEDLFKKSCKKQFDEISNYLKTASSKRCQGTTVETTRAVTVTESSVSEATCQTEEEQTKFVERLLLQCSKKVDKVATWLGDDEEKCKFEISTERPTIQRDKYVKQIQTEIDTTMLTTGSDIITKEQPFKYIETGAETTMLTTDVHTATFDITISEVTKELETTTQVVEETQCSKKISRFYLKFDEDLSKNFLFNKFDQLFQKSCKKQHDDIQKYVKDAPSKRCPKTTVASTESPSTEITGSSCQDEDQQMKYVALLLIQCSKKVSKVADWLGDDVDKCNFELVTERPTIQTDKVMKHLETEADTTILNTFGNFITKDSVFKFEQTNEDTTHISTGFDIISREQPYKNIITEVETTMMSTEVVTDVHEITVYHTHKHMETTTEAVQETECSRKIARVYLKFEPEDLTKNFIFKKFDQQFEKQCKKQHDEVLKYVRDSPSKRCNGTQANDVLAPTTAAKVGSTKPTTPGKFLQVFKFSNF